MNAGNEGSWSFSGSLDPSVVCVGTFAALGELLRGPGPRCGAMSAPWQKSKRQSITWIIVYHNGEESRGEYGLD